MSLSISDPYLPIVNRERHTHEALSRLEAMLADKWVRDCVLFFYGPPQIGKTTLLQEIQRQVSRRGIPSAAVDFADGELNPTEIVKQIREEWARSADFVSGDVIAEKMGSEAAAGRLHNFAQRLYDSSLSRPLVLLLDSLESCPADTLDWLQKETLLPLVNKFHTLVILAGRRQLGQPPSPPWTFELEERTVRFPLEPFSLEETAVQIQKAGASDFSYSAEALMQFTNGIPGLNAIAIRYLADVNKPSEIELREHLVRKILGRTPPKLEEDLLIVSALWQFDRELLEQVLKAVKPGRLADDLLNDLSAQTCLIESSRDGYFRTISATVRPLLDAYYRDTNPEQYKKIQKIAAQWFTDRVNRGDYGNVLNQVYYQARAGESDEAIRSQIYQAFNPDHLKERSARPQELANRIVRDLRDMVNTLPASAAHIVLEITQEYSAKVLRK
jgi:ATP/maltotriose-dependent transcriptional regulator MalT